MKTVKFFAIALTMVVFASCQKDEVGVWAWDNEGNTPVDPTDEYQLVIEHVKTEVDPSTAYPEIIDTHVAKLRSKIEAAFVEEKEYQNIFRLEYGQQISVSFGTETSLLGQTYKIHGSEDGDMAEINGNTVMFNLEHTNNPSVYFATEGKTYTYPEELNCCNYSLIEVVTAENLTVTNDLPATLKVTARHFENGETETLEIPVSFQLTITEVIGWEQDGETSIINGNEASLIAYETVNGVRSGKTEIVKGSYNATLKAKSIARITSKDVLTLNESVATMADAEATFVYAIDGNTIDGVFEWTAAREVTFTLPNGEIVTLPVEAEYSVRSTGFTADNNVYSNAASLYAGEIVVASAVQTITVKVPVDPTFEGYRLVRADQTDRYNADRTHWESTPICAWFTSDTDENDSFFIAFNEVDGEIIAGSRTQFSGVAIPTNPLAMVYVNGAFIPAHVKITETSYRYHSIENGDVYTSVSAITTTTTKLRNPYQGSGVYENEDETTTFALTNGSKLILK